jgi:hypothetical protein
LKALGHVSGEETIAVGGRDINAILMEQKSTREMGNPTTARLWFDPESGVFVKTEATGGIALLYFPGFTNQAISISAPNQQPLSDDHVL